MRPSEFRTVRVSDLQLTQAELSEALGVSASTISLIERDINDVPTIYEFAIKWLVWDRKVRHFILEVL